MRTPPALFHNCAVQTSDFPPEKLRVGLTTGGSDGTANFVGELQSMQRSWTSRRDPEYGCPEFGGPIGRQRPGIRSREAAAKMGTHLTVNGPEASEFVTFVSKALAGSAENIQHFLSIAGNVSVFVSHDGVSRSRGAPVLADKIWEFVSAWFPISCRYTVGPAAEARPRCLRHHAKSWRFVPVLRCDPWAKGSDHEDH